MLKHKINRLILRVPYIYEIQSILRNMERVLVIMLVSLGAVKFAFFISMKYCGMERENLWVFGLATFLVVFVLLFRKYWKREKWHLDSIGLLLLLQGSDVIKDIDTRRWHIVNCDLCSARLDQLRFLQEHIHELN